MPSHLVRALYRPDGAVTTRGMVFVSATKGLENGTLLRMSEVIRQVLEPRFSPRIAVISGPTFAREVARFEPTALVVASEDADLAHRFKRPSPDRRSGFTEVRIQPASRSAAPSRT